MEYAHPPREGQRGRGLGVLMFIAILFLVVVGVVYGGVYLYKQKLEESLTGLHANFHSWKKI